MALDKKITSLTNPSVKRLVRLREHKERSKTKLMIVEGRREVERAFAAGVDCKEIFLCREFLSESDETTWIRFARSKRVALIETTSQVFEKISYGDRQEGIIAVCRQPHLRLRHLEVRDEALFVVVENVEKPGNLGAILRSCDGGAVDGLIVCDAQTDIYNPNVIRSSLGTFFTVPVVQCSSQEALDFLRNNKIKIYAAVVEADKVYTQANFCQSLCFVLGNEHEGISEFWRKNAEGQIRIPMKGVADSLNVSITAAILVYEALRQRN